MNGFTHGGGMTPHDRYITREPERVEPGGLEGLDEDGAIEFLKRVLCRDYAAMILEARAPLPPKETRKIISGIVDLLVEDDDLKNALLAAYEDGINDELAREEADRDPLDDGDRAYDEAKDRKLEEEGDR